MTSDYDAAAREHGFQFWCGTNSRVGPHRQPPDVADVLLHETANAWLIQRLDKTAALLKKPWLETPGELAKRTATCVKDINQTCDVDGLCRGFPARLEDLKERKGDRLGH